MSVTFPARLAGARRTIRRDSQAGRENAKVNPPGNLAGGAQLTCTAPTTVDRSPALASSLQRYGDGSAILTNFFFLRTVNELEFTCSYLLGNGRERHPHAITFRD